MASGSQRLFMRTPARQITWPAPDRAHSAFHEAPARVALQAQVARVRWGHEWIPDGAPIDERIVPDGVVHLVFVLPEDPGQRPHGLAVGASSEPAVVRLEGRIEHVEVELRPGAVPALLGVPSGALAGRAIALGDLWRDRAADLQDRLRATRDPAVRVRLIEQALLDALGPHPVGPPAVVGEALRRIEAAGGSLRVRDLADELGLSERRLEQLFAAQVGLSPKAISRLARFRAGLDRLLTTLPAPAANDGVVTPRAARPGAPRSWAQLALDAGYADQSHLVNEWKAFTGLSPRDFQRRVGFGFLQDRAGAAGYLQSTSRR